MTSIKTLIKGSLVVLFALGASHLAAQNERQIEEQKRKIEALEKKIASEEREISKIKQGRSASEERISRLARQVEARNQLIVNTQKQERLIRDQLTQTKRVAGGLSADLERARDDYADMVREAYRNYRQNNYLTYIFSSRSFTDIARRIANLREVASMRERKMAEITNLSTQVRAEQELLDRRKRTLDSVVRKVTGQRKELQRDVASARNEVRQLSQREKTMLREKIAKEQQRDVAINELRKLTKGNTTGASFSSKTSGLRLPVAEGRVKRYRENMAEITGAPGAAVIAIYEGKVVDVKRNRITDKYDVYVAHGEYITSYANLGSIDVQKGAKVAKNQEIGTIGAAVDALTMETEYKLVFGIYPPSPGMKLRAEDCFKK